MERIRMTDDCGVECEIIISKTKSGESQIDFAIDGNHIIMQKETRLDLIHQINAIKKTIDLWLSAFWPVN